MARMNPDICLQWEIIKHSGYPQKDFFRDKGVEPAVGRAYLHKYRKAQREANHGKDA